MQSKRVIFQILKSNLLGLKIHHRPVETFEIFQLLKFISKKNRRSWRTDSNQVYSLLKLEKPLSYILPSSSFLKSTLKILPGVLIPRNETEEYVSRLIDRINNFRIESSKKLQILDLCTGSGCIGIALACNLRNVELTAIDNSRKSIINTLINIQGNIAQIEFMESSVVARRTDVLKPDFIIDQPFDIIISNPPYISIVNRRNVDRNVLKFENETSLFPPSIRNNGLLFHSKIFAFAKSNLKSNCLSEHVPRIVLEFDGRHQVKDILSIAKNYGFQRIKIHKDFRDCPRSAWIY